MQTNFGAIVMKMVGVYEAKTHLPGLLEEVQRGETVIITKHGRPIAQLIPAPGLPVRTVAETIAAIEAFRRGKRLGSENVKEWIDEGRLR